MKFRTILNLKSHPIYKGGNVEILNKGLFEIKTDSLKHTQKIAINKITEILGSSQLSYFNVVTGRIKKEDLNKNLEFL